MATLSELLDPELAGTMVNDQTVITIMLKDGRHIVGKWFEDAILKRADVPARMIVFNAEDNHLDIME